MTDHELAHALSDLSKSVTEHREKISGTIATLTANVGTLQKAHDGNTKKLDKVLAMELSCAARAGFSGVNARLRKLETGEKSRIESELQEARDVVDEITGQQDVMQRRLGERNYSETPTGRFVKFVMPYVWKGLVIFGIVVGTTVVARCSGEDPRVTANAIQAVTDMVKKTAVDVEDVKAVVNEVASETVPIETQ